MYAQTLWNGAISQLDSGFEAEAELPPGKPESAVCDARDPTLLFDNGLRASIAITTAPDCGLERIEISFRRMKQPGKSLLVHGDERVIIAGAGGSSQWVFR